MDSSDVKMISKTASILAHVKNNNVSYLLGILLLQLSGALAYLQNNVGGCIQ